MEDETKTCKECGEDKTTSEFYRHTHGGPMGKCKPCYRVQQRAYRRNNRVKMRAYDAKRRRGVSFGDYVKMRDEAGGRCEICGEGEDRDSRRWLHIDHCHDTGVIRGLLCMRCNTALGHMKDSPERLRAAARYLEDRSHGLPLDSNSREVATVAT